MFPILLLFSYEDIHLTRKVLYLDTKELFRHNSALVMPDDESRGI